MNWMRYRVVPLLLALILGASPIASKLCIVACAQPSTVPSDKHAHHASGHQMTEQTAGVQRAATPTSHHQEAISGQGASQTMACCAVSLAARSAFACVHADDSQTAAIATAKLVVDVPIALAQVAEGVGPPGATASIAHATSVATPPIPLALRTPLRV